MTQVNCEFQYSGKQELINVGDRFILNCQGNWSQSLNNSAQFLFSDKKQNYILKVLDVKSSNPGQIEMVVTSYNVGEHKTALTLSDGEQKIVTNELEWRVETILEPNAQPQPVPSKGPFILSYPIGLWVSLVFVLVLIAATAVLVVLTQRKKKRQVEELESYKTPLTAIAQFSKDLRLLKKQLGSSTDLTQFRGIAGDLDQCLRLYFVREFMVPALKINKSKLRDLLKIKHKKFYQYYESDLKKVLSELEKANKSDVQLSAQDCEDLLRITRLLVEKIYSQKQRYAS